MRADATAVAVDRFRGIATSATAQSTSLAAVIGDAGRSHQAVDANYRTNPLASFDKLIVGMKAYWTMSQPSMSRASAATPSCWTNCPTSTSSDSRVVTADVRTPATETAAASVAQRSP